MTCMNFFSEGWGKNGILLHQKTIITNLPKYHHYRNIKGYLFKGKIKKTKAWLCYLYCHSWLAVFCNLHWKITDALWFCFWFVLFFFIMSLAVQISVQFPLVISGWTFTAIILHKLILPYYPVFPGKSRGWKQVWLVVNIYVISVLRGFFAVT